MVSRAAPQLPCTDPFGPERGHSNCHHAVIHSLLTRHDPSKLDIHLGTYSDGKTRSIPGVTFHEIKGTSAVNHLVVSRERYIEAKNSNGEIWQRVTTRPGLWGYLKAMPLITFLSNPDGPAIVHATKDIERIMNEVDPRLVIVDEFFAPGIDAAVKSGRKWVILSPNTLKENATDAQGLGAFLWPMVGIGYSFPLPWYLIPLNAIALILTPIIAFFFDSHFRLTSQARHAAGYEGVVTPFVKRTRPVLCMSTPELDYPGIIPSDVICCGPILLPTKSLLQEDPTLYTWIRQGPTMLVSLGSHLAVEEEYAQALLESVRVLLDKRKDVQVLWKLRKWGRNYLIDSDVDLTSILPHVACVVHHGGSNSYHECLAAGVAQIILSPWFDCHDFGIRAEWLGVGRWGNRHAAPRATQKEFTKALLDVVGRSEDDESARKFAHRAREISDVIAGRRNAKGTKYGPIIGDVVSESAISQPSRDKAADWFLSYAKQV